MSEEDCDDELPPISVNCSRRNSEFTMPSAKDLASERARELACERELVLLRSSEAEGATGVVQSDSSGSEGEAALRAAVCELHLRSLPEPAARAAPASTLAHLLPAPTSDTRFLHHYAELLDDMPLHNLHKLNQDIVNSLCELVCEEREWHDEEVVSCGAWLCVAAGNARRGPRTIAAAARRALHALLQDVATEQQTSWIGAAVYAALGAGADRLAASDAARAGGRNGATLAALLASAALRDMLRTEPDLPEWSEQPLSVCELSVLATARWRELPSRDRYLALRLAGRVLAAAPAPVATADRAARDRLLTTLAHHPPDANHHPEQLKVLVGATTLQVLFRDRPAK